MCYSPVRILNPKLKSDNDLVTFDMSRDKLYLEVPCGHCGSCRQRKINDYFVRTVAEFDSCKKNGGFIFFNTFTYAPENVPKYFDLKCFDSKHFIRFKKNLKNRLYNRFGDAAYTNMKVFWVSEYGSQTALPHYHSLFFLTIPGLTAKVFGQLCEEVWDYGGTQTEFEFHNGQPNPYYKNYDACLVEKQDAINYCAKYVNKDLDFLTVINKQKTAPKFKEFVQDQRYLDYVKNQMSKLFGSDVFDSPFFDDEKDKQIDQGMIMSRVQYDMFYPLKKIDFQLLFKFLPRSHYNQFLPFIRLSQAYGISLIDSFGLDQLSKGYVVLPDKELGEKRYRLPKYIDRKVFYDYDTKSKCYTLNDLGKKMKVVRIDYNSCYVEKLMSLFWRRWYVDLKPDEYNKILDEVQFSINESLQSWQDIELYVECLLDGRTWSEYVNYTMVYKDLCIPKENHLVHSDGSVKDNYDLLLNLSNPDPLPKFISYFSTKDLNKFISGLYSNNCCNSLVEFRNFDQICDIYNLISGRISDFNQQEYLRLQKLKSEDKFNNIIHHQKL